MFVFSRSDLSPVVGAAHCDLALSDVFTNHNSYLFEAVPTRP